MTRRANSPDSNASHSAIAQNLRAHARQLAKRSCLRCSGLLVTSYLPSMECDVTGAPAPLWRCVNCGNYLDRFILANRLTGPVSARQRARRRSGPQRTGRLRGMETDLAR